MTYETIQPPFTLMFHEMSKQELKEYLHWFLTILPQRVSELAGAVKQTPGFENWKPDQTPVSLDGLGDWFITQVKTRLRTQEELQAFERQAEYPMVISSEELTNISFSLAFDVGMYLAQVLVKNHPSLCWKQPMGGKKYIDYGQPVLVGFGVLELNPVRISITLAYGLASKKQTGKRLRELYEYWSKHVVKAELKGD